MRLATIRTDEGTQCVRVDDDTAIEIGARDLGELLRQGDDWSLRAEHAHGIPHDLDDLDFAPLVPRPDKIVCVGLNYRSHILERGHAVPDHPTLFAKFGRALIGAFDDITLPVESEAVDFEAELAVVIGSPVRHASPAEATAAIAGFSVLNDVTARDWQGRTSEWLQGKTFEATTPLGPWLETEPSSNGSDNRSRSTTAPRGSAGPDEPGARPGRPGTGLDIECVVDGEVMQSANTEDLIFDPVALVSYISSIITLDPGDVIATGTPGGVGAARTPPRFLAPDDVVVTRIAGIGECRNTCR